MSITRSFKVQFEEPLTETECVLMRSVSIFHDTECQWLANGRVAMIDGDNIRDVLTFLAHAVEVENVVHIEELITYIPTWDEVIEPSEKSFKEIIVKERQEDDPSDLIT